jgi:hypothetical protein
LSSVSGLIFTLAVVAGQARTDRTLAAICNVVDDVKEIQRDKQLSEIEVAAAQVAKVFELAAAVGRLSPGLLAELPDMEKLRVHVNRSAREVSRCQFRLDNLPKHAGDRLKVLESTVPDVLLNLGMYSVAERTLSQAELVRRHGLWVAGDPVAGPLERFELNERQVRLKAGDRLGDNLDAVMAQLQDDPGSGWFAGRKKADVRNLATQVRSDLLTLAPQPTNDRQPLRTITAS